MRRKVLQDIANTICQMIVGWRLGEDYETLAELPDGILHVDLINASNSHSSGSIPALWVTAELSMWLNNRLAVENIDRDQIRAVSIELKHSTDRISTNRKKIISFDFVCSSSIKTDEIEYKGALVAQHTYHQRQTPNPALQRTAPSVV